MEELKAFNSCLANQINFNVLLIFHSFSASMFAIYIQNQVVDKLMFLYELQEF